MKLRKRRKRKTAQALDAAAGITKLWSEWQIGKRATKGVAKVKKSGLKDKLSSTPVKLAGLAAVVGGAGAAIAKKLKGDSQPSYTTSDGDKVSPPDVAPPLAIAPEPTTATDATMPQGGREPAIGTAGLRPSAGDGDTAEPGVTDTPDDPSAGGSVVLREAAADDDEPTASTGSAASEAPEPPASEDSEPAAARPDPTAGSVEPAVPSDEPLPEPATLRAQPEPIADERGGDAPDDESDGAATDRRPDGAAVADDD
ncbi:MAG TPA: hypothetical protein VGO80_18105 [Solirubrobacteraceae bacterium]|jgi:hypothetical protein|nr:hypothetical protein [Solirubrobacteraceae bacterium]